MTIKRSASNMRMDYLLLFAVLLLVILGLMMVYSTTFALQEDSGYFLKRQVLWVALGVVGLLVCARMDYRFWRRVAVPALVCSMLALVVVVSLGRVQSGAKSWLLGRSIQPAEFAKLGVVIYMAAWLASKGEKVRNITYGLVPFAILLGAITGLILAQPDLGTAILIIISAVAMFFIAGAEISQLFVTVLAGGPMLALVIANSGHARERIDAFLHQGTDLERIRYQISGILSALSKGGILGRGLGAGTQKLIPPFLYHTDAIFSVVGEELGLVGCLIVVGLFLFIAYRGLMISFRAPDAFSTLLAFGVTCWITFQAMIHIAVNTETLPFTGITLPFVSYGGSSLTVSLAAIGVLESVARAGKDKGLELSAAFAFGRRNRRPRLSRARRS